jgi:hypothetical protein
MSQATGSMRSGSWSIGKNVPENRKSGVITKRNRTLNALSRFCVALNAKIGHANAMPVSTAAGSASSAPVGLMAPKATMTATNAAAEIVRRMALQPRSPRTRSRTPSGVASIASYVFHHVVLAITGNVFSKAPACIADAASSPGARKAR